MFIDLKSDDETVHYAIGDVHGCLDQLEQALRWCSEDAMSQDKEGVVILLGDYVDRGPRSADVIELLIAGPKEKHIKWLPIKGNHDDMLAKAWYRPEDPAADAWWEHGGQQTLMSYGWDPLEDSLPDHLEEWIPERHARFLQDLPLAIETDTHIFVHAGIRPMVPLREQNPTDLMWIRGTFYNSGYDCGKPVVHGHTPDSRHPRDCGFRIPLDSGCFGTGLLAVAAFDYPDIKPRFKIVGADADVDLDAGPRP